MKAAESLNRDDLYTYETAASIIGCSRSRISEAVGRGDLTTIRDGHKKWLLKAEIDPLAGKLRLASKESRRILATVRGPRDRLAEEMSYGAPIQSVESAVKQIYAKDPSTFMATLTKLIGGRIHVEYT
jgi:hypothetical protein